MRQPFLRAIWRRFEKQLRRFRLRRQLRRLHRSGSAPEPWRAIKRRPLTRCWQQYASQAGPLRWRRRGRRSRTPIQQSAHLLGRRLDRGRCRHPPEPAISLQLLLRPACRRQAARLRRRCQRPDLDRLRRYGQPIAISSDPPVRPQGVVDRLNHLPAIRPCRRPRPSCNRLLRQAASMRGRRVHRCPDCRPQPHNRPPWDHPEAHCLLLRRGVRQVMVSHFPRPLHNRRDIPGKGLGRHRPPGRRSVGQAKLGPHHLLNCQGRHSVRGRPNWPSARWSRTSRAPCASASL